MGYCIYNNPLAQRGLTPSTACAKIGKVAGTAGRV